MAELTKQHLLRRMEESLEAARHAQHPAARDVHFQLASFYEDRWLAASSVPGLSPRRMVSATSSSERSDGAVVSVE